MKRTTRWKVWRTRTFQHVWSASFLRPIDGPIETLSGVFNTGHYHLASKESKEFHSYGNKQWERRRGLELCGASGWGGEGEGGGKESSKSNQICGSFGSLVRFTFCFVSSLFCCSSVFHFWFDFITFLGSILRCALTWFLTRGNNQCLQPPADKTTRAQIPNFPLFFFFFFLFWSIARNEECAPELDQHRSIDYWIQNASSLITGNNLMVPTQLLIKACVKFINTWTN